MCVCVNVRIVTKYRISLHFRQFTNQNIVAWNAAHQRIIPFVGGRAQKLLMLLSIVKGIPYILLMLRSAVLGKVVS